MRTPHRPLRAWAPGRRAPNPRAACWWSSRPAGNTPPPPPRRWSGGSSRAPRRVAVGQHPQAGVVGPEQFAELADDGVLGRGRVVEELLAQDALQLAAQDGAARPSTAASRLVAAVGWHRRAASRRPAGPRRCRVTGGRLSVTGEVFERAPSRRAVGARRWRRCSATDSAGLRPGPGRRVSCMGGGTHGNV